MKAYECSLLCKDIGLRNIMFFETTEGAIKTAVWQKMNEEAILEIQSKKKVSDRLSDNPEENTYIHQLSLPESRVWICYRGRAIRGVKCNSRIHTKTTWSVDSAPETQINRTSKDLRISLMRVRRTLMN